MKPFCAIDVLNPKALGATQADLIVANILANPLVELAESLSGYVRAGGRLVMTGILAEQSEAVISAYQELFEFVAPRHREEWVLLEGLRRTTS